MVHWACSEVCLLSFKHRKFYKGMKLAWMYITVPYGVTGLYMKYKAIDYKLQRLVQSQKRKIDGDTNFYSRVVNKTNIAFFNEELCLPNKGLKYNLDYKHRK